MECDETRKTTIMPPQDNHMGEVCMVDQERWAEIRRLRQEERVSLSEIARRLDLDRKTVRRSLRQTTWQPYRRAVVAETLLTAHADVVRARAPQVQYSARILYQELVGKSHLAIGVGLKAIAQGYRVLFTTAAAMIATLTRAQLENRLEDKLKSYTIPRLLIIDETGYLPMDRTGANMFFQLISRRYEKGPMILTSNQSFGAWGEVFGDRVLATAILDRVLHHAITINIRGHSYRLKDKLKAGLVRLEEASTPN